MKTLERAEVHMAELLKEANILDVMEYKGCSRDEAIDTLLKINSEAETFMNDVYQVAKRAVEMPNGCEYWHLSIKRRDREPLIDWRDKQEIKNQLCGPEHEGVEVFPAESRLVDAANHTHIWVLRHEGDVIPVGFFEGRRVFSKEEAFSRGKSNQEPRS